MCLYFYLLVKIQLSKHFSCTNCYLMEPHLMHIFTHFCAVASIKIVNDCHLLFLQTTYHLLKVLLFFSMYTAKESGPNESLAMFHSVFSEGKQVAQCIAMVKKNCLVLNIFTIKKAAVVLNFSNNWKDSVEFSGTQND